MPTLVEACQQLRIGRVTLAKWIERLGIETTRHEWDYRYQVIAPEDVERIAEARRKVPGAYAGARIAPSAPVIPSYRSLAFDSRESGEAPMRDTAPTRPPRAVRPVTRIAGSLPDGLVSRTDAAQLHGIALTTLRRWCEDGRVETASETYALDRGRFSIAQPITRRGMGQLYQLASPRANFQRCAQCPHQHQEDEAETHTKVSSGHE